MRYLIVVFGVLGSAMSLPYYRSELPGLDSLASPFYRSELGNGDKMPFYGSEVQQFDKMPFYGSEVQRFDKMPFYGSEVNRFDKMPFSQSELEGLGRLPFYRSETPRYENLPKFFASECPYLRSEVVKAFLRAQPYMDADGIMNVINKIPFELNLPGYNFCGPNTNLKERLARGDQGVNSLDEACKLHDIVYDRTDDSAEITQADRELAAAAWDIARDSSKRWSERITAWTVTTAINAKIKAETLF